MSATPWYDRTNIYEFDDTVNQIRMFRDAGEQFCLINPAYAPELRHFLHRQTIYPVPVWSVFDELQGIRIGTPGMLSFRDLDWPADMEWLYAPHGVEGMRNGKKAVFVEFGTEGEMIRVDHFGPDGLERQQSDLFDDRGFHSSTIYYVHGTFQRQEFYDLQGDLQFTREASGRVVFEEWAHFPFRRKDYYGIDDLIAEVLQNYFARADYGSAQRRNAVIIAANGEYDPVILRTVHGPKVILSYFENRFDLEQTEELRRELKRADLAVTDTEKTARIIRDQAPLHLQVTDISPFDTRLSLGKSQRISELKVFMPLDGLDDHLLGIAMKQVFDFMESNPRMILLVVSESQEYETRRAIYEKLRRLMEENGHEGLGIFLKGNRDLENPDAEPDGERILVTYFRSELELIQMLQDVRLIVDVRDQPNLYLQIAGISAGIPQVNYRFTRYVEHQKDGFIIENIYHVTDGLEYYLTGLKHWNEALIYCIREIEQYTGGAQIRKWKKLVGDNGG